MIGAVPATSFEKSKTRVVQALAVDNVTSVSTEIPLFVWSSAFNLILIPETGENTLAVIIVSLEENEILLARLVFPNVVPAHDWAPAVLSLIKTILVESIGSTDKLEEFPPKSITV